MDHEAIDDAVKADAVVEPDLGQPEHVLDVARGDFGPEVEQDLALGGVEFELIGLFAEIDVGLSGGDFCLAISGHVFDSGKMRV